MKWFAVLPLMTLAAAAFTADLRSSWDIYVAGILAGTETVTVIPDGISARGGFTFQGIKIENEYKVVNFSDGRLSSYQATISAAGSSATLSASVSGASVSVKAEQGGKVVAQKDFAFSSATVLLDNNIASHYALLSRVLDPAAGAAIQLQLLVPQAMALVPAYASMQKGTWKWKSSGSEGLAVRWEIGSPAIAPISVYQDAVSREILGVDVPSAKVTYRLTGLTLTQETASVQKPAFIDMTRVAEKDMTVKTGTFSMGATLVYPKTGTGPFPGVLLVAGSGANDRDETIGPNKPLRDIAVALANRGFAVLRFDKRTFAYQGKVEQLSVPTLTVKEEFIDDAVSALRMLAAEKIVDGNRLSIVGHSLGAWGLPFIYEGLGADAARIRHLVFIAPAGRDWGDMLLRQLRFQLSLAPDTGSGQAVVAEVEKRVAEYRSAGAFSTGFMGARALYWNDLFGRDAAASAGKIRTDMLFVRGSKDIQVMGADFQSWQTALAGRPNAAFVTLPNLNHLLFETEGQSTGAEYFREGYVSPALIDLLAGQMENR